MPNRFFASDDDRAIKVKELFTTIAPRYDLLNDLQSLGLHRFWKRRLVQLACVHAGDRALDVCCGTGDLALALARRGAQTVGLDFNEPMLALARERASNAVPRRVTHHSSRVTPPEFLQGDAQQLPFPDHAFDIVTVGYGLRNLADWQRGLREMQRVAKPGGRVLVLDFGKPQNDFWRKVYFAYLRVFVPKLARAFCVNAEAYAYILESLRQYPAQEGVAAQMRQMNMANVRIINFLGGMMSINYGEKPSQLIGDKST